MSFSINPLTLQSMKIGTKDQQGTFLYQLGALLSQMTQQINTLSTQNGLSAILNGSGALNYSAFNIVQSNLGTVSTNQTVNANSAATVSLFFTMSASITLTVNNLGLGVPIQIAVHSTGAFTLKLAFTVPGGTAYSVIDYATAGGLVDLIATGWVSGGASSRTFTGITFVGPSVVFAFV